MSSQADYSLNCWDNTWQGAVAELTAIRNALQKEDTAGSLLYKYILTHPELLDSIHEIEHLPDLDWELIEPKKGCRKKLLAKQWLNERAYNKLFDAVNTLLKPIKAPEIKLIN